MKIKNTGEIVSENCRTWSFKDIGDRTLKKWVAVEDVIIMLENFNNNMMKKGLELDYSDFIEKAKANKKGIKDES